MQSAPLPPDEAARLRALHQLDVLDSGPEQEFDALIQVASLVCGVPISLISLVDTQRQWFKANIGLPGVLETPRDIAFCAHAILDDGIFEVPDATKDARFFDNPIVLSQPDIRFYAGAPIVLSGGERVGTLCVIDRQPQTLNTTQRDILRSLALAAAQALEGRKAMRALHHTAQTLSHTKSVLTEAQERMQLATDCGGIGIWDLDLVSGELLWDAQNYRLYGVEPSDQVQAYSLWASQLHPDDKAATEAAFADALASGQDFANDFRVVWADGSIHHLKAYGRLRLDAQGKLARMVGTNIEVTAAVKYAQSLQEARHQAEQASQSKGQFLANMSHEIRTPMNAILGMLNLLQTTTLTARQLDYVSKTEGAAKSLLGLLNDILDFSKVEAGKMTLECEPFRLDRLLRDLSVVLSANVGAKNVEVLFEVDPTLPQVVLGDALRLQQVLINLGGNALKFTTQGQVGLFLRNLGVRQFGQGQDTVAIEFTVQDSGIGIAPEHQAHIFSGFSQAEASTTRRFGGTGLGLAICKRLVELMGGAIRIDSTLGVGSTFAFTLELPVPQEVSAALAAPLLPTHTPHQRNSARQLVGMRILVVEDNLINQQVAEELLSAQGAIVSMAANGKLGVEAVAAAAPQFDVVLMDIQMPVMDGYTATRAIREELGLIALPIIAMTANAMSSDRDACLAGGMNEHVGKPFDMVQLVSLLLGVSGFAPLADPSAVHLTQSAAPEVPGLELGLALARMSGLKTLYTRTARDFALALDTQLAELALLLQSGQTKPARMLLHTLKGNAGTLGAPALAQFAGQLETMCTSADGMAQCSAQLGAFSTVATSTRSALLQAVALLDIALEGGEATAPTPAVDAPAVLAGLHELSALLLASDMAALQRYAELRATLSGLPADFVDALDLALQDLEFTQAHGLCVGMLQQLQC
jgi:signal transduction histidine kinase/DNA-binding NarL/FixJ family response regulator